MGGNSHDQKRKYKNRSRFLSTNLLHNKAPSSPTIYGSAGDFGNTSPIKGDNGWVIDGWGGIFPSDIIPAGETASGKIRQGKAWSIVSAVWKWRAEKYRTEKQRMLFFCYLFIVPYF
jgi:hypothetical protein